jgi:hypothetical protein
MTKKGPLFGLVAALCSPSLAHASELSADEPKAPTEEVELVPLKLDHLGGHFLLSLQGAFVAPFGRLSQDVESLERSGNAFGTGLHLGYGLDRYVSAGAYGEMDFHWDSKRCPDCSATSIGAGLEVQYHLVQGLRLDPWLSYGVGFRRFAAEVEQTHPKYWGLEWLRVAIGADWFALSQFALGPFAQFTAATMLKTPGQEDIGGTSWRYLMGLNVLFDLPGR